MSYTGKTDWKYDDLVTEQDLNRIEAGIVDHETRITDNEAHIANHESRIDAVETDLSDAPSAEVTLTHGMQVVTAPRKSPFRMQSLRGRTVIDETGMRHVVNPYIRRYGENLLPPFTEWEIASTGIIEQPYKYSQPTIPSGGWTRVQVNVIPEQDYYLTFSNSGDMEIGVFSEDTNSVVSDYSPLNRKFNTGGNSIILIFIRGTKLGTITNPMLNIGDQPQPFAPREDTMLAFPDVTLCSNTDGTLYDEIFKQEGRYYKRAQYKAMDLDGSLKWEHNPTSSTFKIVKVKVTNAVIDSGQVIKYDGKQLAIKYPADAADQTFLTGSPDSSIYLTVSNADSGWGPDYQPTRDEIKAYFYGWRMFDNRYGRDSLYNVTDGTGNYKTFRQILNINADSGTGNVAPTFSYSGWTSYKLQYQLATSTIEEVQSVGELTLLEGQNQIEVGCGAILREKANPKLELYGADTGKWFINSKTPTWEHTRLSNQTETILFVYKNNNIDYTWEIKQLPSAYGKEAAGTANYDPTAVYTVDYIALGPYASIPNLTGTYETTLKNVVDRLVEGEAQLAERVGVLELVKKDKYPAPMKWIEPTLLNGWTKYNLALRYAKNELDEVILKGAVSGGTIGTDIFVLPSGYRPKETKRISAVSFNGTTYVAAVLQLTADGKVTATAGGTNHFWLDGITIPTT